MASVRGALARLLAAHDPAPAFVLDGAWTVLQADRGTVAMMGLLGVLAAALAGGLNLLQALLAPGGPRPPSPLLETVLRTQDSSQLRFFQPSPPSARRWR